MKKLKSLLLLIVLCITTLATGQAVTDSTVIKFYSTDTDNNVHIDKTVNTTNTTIYGAWLENSAFWDLSNDSLYAPIPINTNVTVDYFIDTTIFNVGDVSKSPDSLTIEFYINKILNNISPFSNAIGFFNAYAANSIIIDTTNNNNIYDTLVLLDVIDTVSYEISNGTVSLTLNSTHFSDTLGQHSVFILFDNSNGYYNAFVEIKYNVLNGTVGLAENRLDDVEPLLVYPNPVVDILNVSSGELSNNSAKYIYNTSGQLIMEFYTNSVNIKHLPKGVYILTNGNKKIKFVKL